LAVLATLNRWSGLLAGGLWAASLAAITLAALHHDRFTLERLRSWRRGMASLRRREVMIEAASIVLVTAVAFALRAYDLEHFPPAMHGDEGEIGLVAMRILENRSPPAPFATSWGELPALTFYSRAGAMAVFGRTEGSLRMLTAILGTACVPLLYWVGRLGWGRLAGMTAAWLMAVSHLSVHYSRVSLNMIDSTLGMILLVLLLAMAYERSGGENGSPEDLTERAFRAVSPVWPFAAAGLVVGLSQYFYYASRLVPLVAAALLLVLWQRKKASAKQILWLWLAALIAFAPLGAYYLTHTDALLNRTEFVNIFSEVGMRHTLGPGASWPRDIISLVRVQLERNLGFLVRKGDASGFYFQNVPAFDAITAALFWLGLGATLTGARRYHELAALMWLGLGLILGGIMTIDSPSAQRLLIMVPAVYLMGGVFAQRAWGFISSGNRVRSAWLGASTLAVLAILTLGVNWNIYFRQYAYAVPGMTSIMVAREMSVAPERYRAFLMGDPVLHTTHGVIRFVAREADARDIAGADDLPSSRPDDQGLLVIATANRADELEAVKERFPGGTTTSHSDPAGRLVYVAYRLPPGGDQ
jgi:4-amino-4-deoxy-L-arabinose transferase-like glycosyltransferase